MRDRILGIAIAVAGLAMVIATMIVAGGFEANEHPLSIAGLGFTLVGGLIVYKTGHRIGWVSASAGLMFAANGLLNELPDRFLVGGLAEIAWMGSLFATGLLVFWFPTGQPVSRRWTWTMWTAVTAMVISGLVAAVGSPESELAGASFLVIAGFLVVSVVSLVVRYARSTQTVRQQIKWFTFFVISVPLLNLLWEVTANVIPLPQVVWDLLLAAALLGIPVSIGMAILRYHLYEIDRLVSRTVTYVVVLGLLALLFAAMTWLPWILIIGVGSDGTVPPFIIAGATLAAAALFNPLRKLVQRRVDRRFNRSHYDANAVAEKFGEDLRDTHDMDEIIGGLIAVVSTTLSPTSVIAWTRTRDS